jgi:hypothetical protein
MSASVIGKVKSGKGNSYDVKWDERSGDIYVTYAGVSKVGNAKSAGDAMRQAEAWLYNK